MSKIRDRIVIGLGLVLLVAWICPTYGQQKVSKMADVDVENVKYTIPQTANNISPLFIGEKMPIDISLPNQTGELVNLNKLVSAKPTIIVFYRGGWCPYCSKQLSGLQEISNDLITMGYQLVAISTDKPEGLKVSSEEGNLQYTLLSDADGSVAKDFGVAYKAPENYWKFLPETTGGKNIDLLLPVPSVFMVDRKGKIVFEYINPNFKERINPKLLTAVAETMIVDL